MVNKARKATQDYHNDLYVKHTLFQKGASWLEKPNNEIIDIYKKYFNKRKSINILDLGSGVGRNAIPLARLLKNKSSNIYCVDYLEIAINKLNKYAKDYGVADKLNGFISPVENYKIQINFYDYIIAHSVLTHTRSKEIMFQVIDNMIKGTKNNGIIYIHEITNPQMFDIKSKQQIDPDAEIDISYEEFEDRLMQVFSDWEIFTLSKNPYREEYLKDGKKVIWQCDYLSFIARKKH
ncbi:class I SAM-dependent methyltransferase [Candidatus Beckwithbacteria bacterium]|nr:class I SAM-dependent methyltransferase [Candidatus Beckwithbacteria bacterium]